MVRHLHTNTTGEIFSKWHSIRPRTCSHRDPTGLSVSAISIPADSRNPSHRIVTNAHGSRTAASPISGHEQKFSAFVDDSTLCFFNVQINSPMSWKLSTGSAWLAWTFRHLSASETWSLSPAFLPRRCSPESQGPQPNISTEICSWLAPGREECEKVKRNQRNSIQRMQEHLVATRTGRTLLLQYHDEIPILADTFTQEHTTFWATYKWDLNPWILNERVGPFQRVYTPC
uniref:Uncharacterized protein n=1 Tax=Hyaloperonospora arabidopsidis (strain Emoy2) TaxID=559515 RepID=M4BV74_HYAAE